MNLPEPNRPLLRIAIQKSGRLSQDSIQLIKECGIDFAHVAGQLIAKASNFDAELLFLRDDDIPGYVADGVADLGIVGLNVLSELPVLVNQIMPLGFSKCRLSIAVERHADYTGPQWLDGKNIATSYPNVVGAFLERNKIKATIHEISGSVEIAPGIGLAEAICDIVSSGSTLLSNGLKEVEVIFKSEAILISGPDLSDAKTELIDKLVFRINAVKKAKKSKYIVLNAPNEAVERIKLLLPGMRSPSILPLAESGWCSLHSVIDEDEFWDSIEMLKAAGAQGILVVPIEKMIL